MQSALVRRCRCIATICPMTSSDAGSLCSILFPLPASQGRTHLQKVARADEIVEVDKLSPPPPQLSVGTVRAKWPKCGWMHEASRRARSWWAGPGPEGRRSSSAATLSRTQSDGAAARARNKGPLAGVTDRRRPPTGTQHTRWPGLVAEAQSSGREQCSAPRSSAGEDRQRPPRNPAASSSGITVCTPAAGAGVAGG
jgi:hypothetical protein